MRRALALLILCMPAPSALAAGEGEMALTAGPGLAVGLTSGARVGASVDVRLLYGLTDSWSARLGLASSWLASSGESAAARVVTPALGMTVAADVLNLVPSAELGIVMGDVRGGGPARQYLGGQLGMGLEYLLTRRLVVSLLGRVDYLALRLAGPDATDPLTLTFALHLGHLFGS